MRSTCGSRLLSQLLRAVALIAGFATMVSAYADPALVHNYDSGATGASGAVWAIARAGDGTLFVGSNQLSIYDGRQWETLEIPGAYAFRALEAESEEERQARGRLRASAPANAGGEHEPNAAGRIWVGAIGAIGYLEKTPVGRWVYTSLAGALQAIGIAHTGDVWQVHALGRGALFVTTDRILRWNGEAFESWKMPADPHLLSFSDAPDVLVYQSGRGLWRVRATGQPTLEIADNRLPARPMTWYSPLPRGTGFQPVESTNMGRMPVAGQHGQDAHATSDMGKMPMPHGVPPGSTRGTGGDPAAAGPHNTHATPDLATAFVGLGADVYRLIRPRSTSGDPPAPRFERLETLSASLGHLVPSYAEWLDRELLAVGTYRAGVLLIDREGRIRSRLDRAAGLEDDNVTALQVEGAGRLWIGHGSGFARVDAPGYAARFDYRSHFGSGLPRSVIARGGTTHVLTTRGFFRIEAPPPSSPARPAPADASTRFVPLGESKEMLHAAAVVAGQVWFCGFGGMWRVVPGGVEQEYYSSKDVLQVAETPSHPGEVLFLEGYELKLLRPTKQGWAARRLNAHIHDTPVSLLEIADEPGGAAAGVWISTVKDGIYRFAWSSDRGARSQRLRLVAHYRPGRGLPAHAKNPRLIRCGARFYAFTDTEVLVLGSNDRAFEPAAEMAGYSGIVATSGSHLEPNGKSSFWLVQPRVLTGLGTYGLLRVEGPDTANGRLVWHPVELPGLDQAGRPTAAAVVAGSGGMALWVAGTEAVVRVDLAHLRPAAAPPPASFLAIRTDDRLRPLVPAPGLADELLWETATKRVTFSYTTPGRTGGEAVFFQTRLSGVETEWSTPVEEPSREFAGLGHRKYVFEARALDRFGRAGAAAAYAFAIAPPWLLTWPAFAGYVALTLGGIASLMRWRMVRLRHQNEKLNRLVADRTRELELSNTVRGEFLENISHEIRNPLNGLNGLLGLLQKANLPRAERELMDSLQVCARNLNRTYEEVLGFSKLEYGYITKNEIPFSLHQMLTEIVAGLKWQGTRHNCRIMLEWPPRREAEAGGAGDAGNGDSAHADGTAGGEGRYIGDRNKLATIVTNFLINALKYAPGKPVEIKVEIRSVEPDIDGVSIEVCDHGPGIPSEEQALIFQKFVRGSNAKTGNIAGTGLGLATCRVMAKALGGSIGVESESGQGCVFFVRMPLRRAPGTASSGPASDAAGDPTSAAPGADWALIVEDEQYNQLVLRGIVLQLGFRPAVAADADEALALMKSHSFTLILLDWELPGVKGGEVARYARSRPQGEQPVIIATTGHDSEEMRRRCRECGMDDFLLKPYDFEAIRRCIARVLEQRGGGNRDGSPPAGAFSSSGDANERQSPVPDPMASLRGRGSVPAGASGEAGIAPRSHPPADRKLNLRAFDHYAAGAPHKADQASRNFVGALEHELAALEQAVAAADRERTTHHAHRLRSLAGLLGATRFTQAIQRLETLGPSEEDARLLVLRDLMAAADSLKHQLATHRAPAEGA